MSTCLLWASLHVSSQACNARTLSELGFEVGAKAMLAALTNHDDVEIAIACCCYGDTTPDQRFSHQFGMTSISIYDTKRSSALSLSTAMCRIYIHEFTCNCLWTLRRRPVVLFSNIIRGPARSEHQSGTWITHTSFVIGGVSSSGSSGPLVLDVYSLESGLTGQADLKMAD